MGKFGRNDNSGVGDLSVQSEHYRSQKCKVDASVGMTRGNEFETRRKRDRKQED